MARFRLTCVVHRRSASGVLVDQSWIEAQAATEAGVEAARRFRALVGDRSGLAGLIDESGRTIWSAKRAPPKEAGSRKTVAGTSPPRR